MRAAKWSFVGLALALPAAAWANYGTMGVFGYPGLWPWLVVALILLVETPVIVWVCRVPWGTGLLAAVVANGVTAVLGLTFGVGRIDRWDAALLVATFNALVEWPFVRWLVGRYWRKRSLPGTRWEHRVLFAALLMNFVSAPIIPVIERQVPNPNPHVAVVLCDRHLRELGAALRMYQAERGGLPPIADMDGLQRCLLPYAKDPNLFRCPGVARGRFFPLLEPQPYACCNFRQVSGGDATATPAVWDTEPRHMKRRNVLFLDGTVMSLEPDDPRGP